MLYSHDAVIGDSTRSSSHQALSEAWRGDPVKLVPVYILRRSNHAPTALTYFLSLVCPKFQDSVTTSSTVQKMYACLAPAISEAIYFPNPCWTRIGSLLLALFPLTEGETVYFFRETACFISELLTPFSEQEICVCIYEQHISPRVHLT